MMRSVPLSPRSSFFSWVEVSLALCVILSLKEKQQVCGNLKGVGDKAFFLEQKEQNQKVCGKY